MTVAYLVCCRVLLICGVVVFIIIVVVIAFYYSLQNYAKDESTRAGGIILFPEDTRTLLRPTLCEKLTLSIKKSSNRYTASITVLKSTPSLSKQPSFDFVTQPSNSSGGYVDYQFHFYSGSEVGVSACRMTSSNSQVTFYFLKNKDFNEWVKSKSFKITNKFEVSEDCQQQGSNTSHNYSAEETDHYHLVFSSSLNSLGGINSSFTITQVQYGPRQSGDILSNCSVTDKEKPCTVNVPVSAASSLLSYTHASLNTTTWTSHENTLMVSCSTRRWLIFVISLGATVTIVVLILLTVAILSAVIACRNKREVLQDDPDLRTPLVN